MTVQEIFSILEIEETKDENAIKTAYRKKLAVTNPEDNPEGFKRLRSAYEEAVEYAKQQDAQEEKQEDTTPSGLWVTKAVEIYENIHTRQDIANWEALFEEEIFQSIEGEELCREKLLAYMMNHFYFPTNVWELLDKKLRICEDSTALKEMFPAEYINFIVGKCNRGEDVDFKSFSGPADGNYDLIISNYYRSWNAIDANDTALAKQLCEETDKLNCYHPVMDIIKANIMKADGKTDEAIAHLAAVYEKYSDDLSVAYNYGDLCWKSDRKDEAAEVFKKIKEGNKKHYMSNVYLLAWYCERGEYEEAKTCGETAMSEGGNDDLLRQLQDINEKLMSKYYREYHTEGNVKSGLELGWCYLQNDRLHKCYKLIQELEGKVPAEEETSYYSLCTKLSIESALYEETLEYALKWRAALKVKIETETGDDLQADQDRIYHSYAIRINALHMMGFANKDYWQEAFKEFDALEQVEPLGPRMLMEKAQIYLANEEPEKAIEIADMLIEKMQVFGAYVIKMQAYVALWDASGVIDACKACNYYFPDYARAYEEAAKVYCDLGYNEQLKELLDFAKERNIKSQYLEAYEYRMNNPFPEDSRSTFNERLKEHDKEYKDKFSKTRDRKVYDEGYEKNTIMLYEIPGNYMLIDRGLFSMRANELELAELDFKKVLERTPNEQFALNNLGCVYKYRGEYDKALVCFRKSIRYMDDEPNVYPYSNMRQTYELLGEYEKAAEVALALIERFPDRKEDYLSELRDDYAYSKQLDKALELMDEYRDTEAFVANGDYKSVWFFVQKMDACKKADNLVEYKKYLDATINILRSMPPEKQAGIEDNVMMREAWYHFIGGDIDGAIDRMTKIYRNKKEVFSRTDALQYLIYMWSVKDYMNKRKNQQKGAVGKLLGKMRTESSMAPVYATALKSCDMSDAKMLYRQRKRSWYRFLIAYYTESHEQATAAMQAMKNCQRCRACDEPDCINYKLAVAMMLEKENKYKEAYDLYKAISKMHPSDWFSKAKLVYLGLDYKEEN